MIDNVVKNSETNMHKGLDAFKLELSKVRTGRAHPGLVENIKVDYYGTETALKHIASISATDSRTISITPWEKVMLKAIEKALLTADLGINPVVDANTVRVPVPVLTEERRKELVKTVKSLAEQSRIAIRNIRRDSNSELKELLKKKTINEDDERRAQDSIQKLTDKFIAEIDKAVVEKESELMTV